MQWAFGFAVLALALSLHAFPWDGVQNWLGRAAGKMAGMFQYPWRFLSLATVLLCLASVLAVQLLKEKNARLAKGAAAALVACALLTAGVVQTQITSDMGELSYNVFLSKDPNVSTGVGEYLIEGTSSYETIWAQPKPGSDKMQLLSYEKRGGKAYLEVENDGEAADISYFQLRPLPCRGRSYRRGIPPRHRRERPYHPEHPGGLHRYDCDRLPGPRLLARLRTCLRFGAPGQHRLGRKPEEKETVNTRHPRAWKDTPCAGVPLWKRAVTCGVKHKEKDLEATLQGLFLWWSIVHSTRTFMQVFHYRVPCVSSQETEEHQRVSTPAHGLF